MKEKRNIREGVKPHYLVELIEKKRIFITVKADNKEDAFTIALAKAGLGEGIKEEDESPGYHVVDATIVKHKFKIIEDRRAQDLKAKEPKKRGRPRKNA